MPTTPAIGGMRAPMTTQRILLETIGWSGAALILAAYILRSKGRLSGQSRAYQWMNVVGSNGAIPSATLNVVWAAIGFYTLWRVRHRVA